MMSINYSNKISLHDVYLILIKNLQSIGIDIVTIHKMMKQNESVDICQFSRSRIKPQRTFRSGKSSHYRT